VAVFFHAKTRLFPGWSAPAFLRLAAQGKGGERALGHGGLGRNEVRVALSLPCDFLSVSA